jgi:hypothetical protein
VWFVFYWKAILTCKVFVLTVNFELSTAKTFEVKLKLICSNLENKFEVNLIVILLSTSNFFDVDFKTLQVKNALK